MTIREVAKLAGVSPAAVSRYINGGPLSPDKREAIRKVIEKTGYRPSVTARTMRTGGSGQIGVIVPRIQSDAVSQIIAGITGELSERGYLAILGSTQERRELEPEYIEMLQDNQVEGIILMGTVMTPRLADAIRASSKPVVVTGQSFDGVCCVYHDDFHAVGELMRRMIEKGRKNIVYIGVSDDDEAVGKQRKKGAQAAWKEAGHDPSSLPVLTADFSAGSGRECIRRLLRENPQTQIDGVICATDRIAIGAMDALIEAGKRIPEDVSVAGVGDSWAGDFLRPKLTTARLYHKKCGETAAKLLLELIGAARRGESAAVSRTMLSYSICERESL